MTQSDAPLDDAQIDAMLDRMSKSANQGCGLVYELYAERFMEAIDAKASRLPEVCASRLICRAVEAHDYLPADQRTPITANGCCPCGLDDMTCPNGHFEGQEFDDETMEKHAEEAWQLHQEEVEERYEAEAMNEDYDRTAAEAMNDDHDRAAAAIVATAQQASARGWRALLARILRRG